MQKEKQNDLQLTVPACTLEHNEALQGASLGAAVAVSLR